MSLTPVPPIRKLAQASYPRPSEGRPEETRAEIPWSLDRKLQPFTLHPSKTYTTELYLAYSFGCFCHSLVAKLCLTLLRPSKTSPPGSSVQGISQARVVEWVAISFSRGSSRPKDGTHVSCIDKWIFYY